MMKKKLSLALAFILAATMMAGCKKTDDASSGLPDTQTTPSLTTMTMPPEETEETTEPPEETTESETESETTTETEETTESETTTTSVTSETTSVSATETATAAAAKEWNETEISETLYIKSDCYSRVRAIVGSDSVKKYTKGTKINVVAATDTGYYKLADGTFIHSDYVTEEAPSQGTEATTTKKKSETTAKQEDPDNDKTSSSTPINANYNKDHTERYPYKQLSKSQQKLYDNILNAAENFSRSASVPDGLTSDDVYKVYQILYNNEPQLFWLSTTVPTNFGGELDISYSISRDEAAKVQKTIDSTASSILKKANGYSSTVSKLKVIHDWVVTNNTFSLEGTFATCSIYDGIAGNGNLQCAGYAKSVLYLCDLAGIDCMVILGTNPEGSSHAWNIVYCDNGYYILDTTWDDPYGLSYKDESSYVRYEYFLSNDDNVKNYYKNQNISTKRDGTRIKLFDPPACTKTACYYFKAYNKEYSDLDSAVEGLYAEIDEAIANHKQVAHVRVTKSSIYDDMVSNKYWKKFQDHARSESSDVDKLIQQKSLVSDTLVVHYDIVYK